MSTPDAMNFLGTYRASYARVGLQVDVRVALDTWAETYGQATRHEARLDALEHVQATVEEAVRVALERLANGAELTSVRIRP